MMLVATILWFFPGFMSDGLSDIDQLRLKESFAAEELVVKKWGAVDVAWDEAVARADEASEAVVGEIMTMNANQRNELMLVGHSLGGRVVSHSLVKLGELNASVKAAVLLAPAISIDDRQAIGLDLGCSSLIMVVGEDDVVLEWIYPLATFEYAATDAASLCAKADFSSNRRICQKYVVPHDFMYARSVLFPSHNASVYIEYLAMIKSGATMPQNQSLGPRRLPANSGGLRFWGQSLAESTEAVAETVAAAAVAIFDATDVVAEETTNFMWSVYPLTSGANPKSNRSNKDEM